MKTLLKTHDMILSRSKNPKNHQLGYNLLEVMVAALILSTAILGIASLQMIGMKGTQQSLMKQQAMGVVQNMIERMRSNPAGVTALNYEINSNGFNCSQPVPNCAASNCTPAQIALVDTLNIVCGMHVGAGPNTGGVKVTNANDNPILVDGTLDVVCVNCALGDVQLTVGWNEREFGEGEASPREALVINTRVITTP